jgi:6-phosphogluconolactonase
MSHSETSHTALGVGLLNELYDMISILDSRVLRNICLTGGRSAEVFYELVEARKFLTKNCSNFYFGDERCVVSDHPESNYQLVVRSLFPDGVNAECNVYRMHGEVENLESEANRYAELLPESLDLLLLSVGEDGHIASLFPGSTVVEESQRKVVLVKDAPKLPAERLTITSIVIHAARKVIVMASGAEKGAVLAAALQEPDRIKELPVRLTIGSTWILDPNAAKVFLKKAPENHLNTRIIYA